MRTETYTLGVSNIVSNEVYNGCVFFKSTPFERGLTDIKPQFRASPVTHNQLKDREHHTQDAASIRVAKLRTISNMAGYMHA